MIKLNQVHHIAVICSDYEISKQFYTGVLGFSILAENYRAERKSYKLDLKLGDRYVLELFSFPDSPKRSSGPEACGLRHLAFETDNIALAVEELKAKGVICESIRVDEFTGKRFTFFTDPDDLPLELYER